MGITPLTIAIDMLSLRSESKISKESKEEE